MRIVPERPGGRGFRLGSSAEKSDLGSAQDELFYVKVNTVTCHLTVGIRPEECIVRRFHP